MIIKKFFSLIETAEVKTGQFIAERYEIVQGRRPSAKMHPIWGRLALAAFATVALIASWLLSGNIFVCTAVGVMPLGLYWIASGVNSRVFYYLLFVYPGICCLGLLAVKVTGGSLLSQGLVLLALVILYRNRSIMAYLRTQVPASED